MDQVSNKMIIASLWTSWMFTIRLSNRSICESDFVRVFWMGSGLCLWIRDSIFWTISYWYLEHFPCHIGVSSPRGRMSSFLAGQIRRMKKKSPIEMKIIHMQCTGTMHNGQHSIYEDMCKLVSIHSTYFTIKKN